MDNDYSLLITCKAWNKNTEDLFDFDADDIVKYEYKLTPEDSRYYITKSLNNKIEKNESKVTTSENSTFFFRINYLDNHFTLTPSIACKDLMKVPGSQIADIWMKLPSNEFTEIKINDIIKLGRVRIKYSNFHNHSSIIPTNSSVNNDLIQKSPQKQSVEKIPKSQKDICRICLSRNSSIENPLISPCGCTGSIKYIHFKCLQKAIASKFQITENSHFKLITWKNFYCEICLCEYPQYLCYEDKTYNTVDYSSYVFEKCAVFDYFLYDDEELKPFRMGVLIVNFSEEQEISIGRTQSNNVKLKNISVSRVHCSMKMMKNVVYLRDNNSKFGTMLFMNHNLSFVNHRDKNLINSTYEANKCTISSGKYCFEIMLKKNYRLCGFLNCCRSTKQVDDFCELDCSTKTYEEKEKEKEKEFLTRKSIYEDNFVNIDKIISEVDD